MLPDSHLSLRPLIRMPNVLIIQQYILFILYHHPRIVLIPTLTRHSLDRDYNQSPQTFKQIGTVNFCSVKLERLQGM